MTTMAWDAQPRFRTSGPSARNEQAGPRSVTAASGAVQRSGPALSSVRRGAALRLTRRGRVVVTLLAASAALVAGLSAQAAMADAPRAGMPVETRTVAAGETLWEIASSVAGPGEDRRDVVAELVQLNGLSGSALQAGQEILVPVP